MSQSQGNQNQAVLNLHMETFQKLMIKLIENNKSFEARGSCLVDKCEE